MRRDGSRLGFLMGLSLCLAAWLAPRAASAHKTDFTVYSKFEATTDERSLAIVLALDKGSTLGLLERDLGLAEVSVESLPEHIDYFSTYVFGRLFVFNAGKRCAHPAKLGRFFWDASTGRVLAVTHFECEGELTEIKIRSTVTHDMPLAHQTVGDVLHAGTLVRSYFYDDNVETILKLSEPNFGKPKTRPGRGGRIGAVARTPEPDKKRRYDALAFTELGNPSASPAQSTSVNEPAARSFGALLWHFLGQGVWHIVIGYDHVLFILTLLLGVCTFRRLAWVVTSFTVAHSITLLFATLGWVRISGDIIEPLIALTVFAVALDVLLRPSAEPHLGATFLFGLIHGFGLSGVLVELGVVGGDLTPALLGFNLGVEVGQLCIVAPIFPLAVLLRKRRTETYERGLQGLGIAVAALSLVWFFERASAALFS